ncbi:chromate efflux transporter [Sphingomonas cannabina]|uniref:chromate efflux transporter n=1 Tax=Sphingomonas cannabina TaxID=2899123 RepID=UPI001F21AECD|nr:chromate efflux transporter [Sphingomonas cannabina]UIJ44484.1 chromate efflux transporter [Sphingomonas cannabina]
MTSIDSDAAPPAIGLAPLFLKFLRFGCLAFGGPVAQIAMIRQALVEEERWITGARFNRLLAVMQVLPGPEAHELCVHMGMVARGRWGGLFAGLGFMLPGFVLMLGCAAAYQALIAGRAGLAGVLLGVQIVVVAIIARAVERIGRHALTDRLLGLLALASLIATLAGVSFWIPLATAGLVYAFAIRPGVAIAFAAGGLLLAFAFHALGDPSAAASQMLSGEATAAALFVAGLKGGLLTFGGAYTAIPYVRHDTVGRGWMSDGTFLDGVALAGMLPAPLVIFGTFVGYVAGGWIGALAVTAGIFLPAFAFSMILFERLERIVENPALHRLLDGIAGAVVGIIAATCLQLGLAVLDRAPALWPVAIVFVAALTAAWFWKGRFAVPALVALGGAIGAALFS